MYYLKTDRLSKRIYQMIEIVLRFFMPTLKDHLFWPEIFPQIQFILNKTSSSTISKTPNKVAYRSFSQKPVDILSSSKISFAF